MEAGTNNVDGLLPHLARLEVSGTSTAHSSDPATPVDSPQTLESDLRDWLNAALSAAQTNPKVYTKLLVSNAAAGSIIGKGGGNINDFQQKTYAKIQLSKASEYFPGTMERILMLTGRLKQVVAALTLIFSKLSKEGVAPLSPKSKASLTAVGSGGGVQAAAAAAVGASMANGEAGSGPGEDESTEGVQPQQAQQQEPEAPLQMHLQPRLLVKLLVPQSLCGIIIGRSGSTIRQFAADTQTSIKVTAADGPAPPLSHRIVTVAGHQEGVVKAIALLTLKMSEDHKFSLFNSLPVLGATTGAMPAALVPVMNTGMSGGQGGASTPQGMQIMHSMGGIGMASPYAHHLQPLQFMAMAQPGGMFAAAPPHPHAMAAASYRPPPGEMQNGGGSTGGSFTSLAISLTEEQGNFLLGQDGRGMSEVAQASGVRVKVEKEPRPGGKGQCRKVVLSGSADSVQFAQWLLSQRLAMATAAANGYNASAAAAAAAAVGMIPPSYMQQQVAGTTYFQPMAYAMGPQGMSPQHPQVAYTMPQLAPGMGMPQMSPHLQQPQQHMQPPQLPNGMAQVQHHHHYQHANGQMRQQPVAMGMPQPMPLRGRAPA